MYPLASSIALRLVLVLCTPMEGESRICGAWGRPTICDLVAMGKRRGSSEYNLGFVALARTTEASDGRDCYPEVFTFIYVKEQQGTRIRLPDIY